MNRLLLLIVFLFCSSGAFSQSMVPANNILYVKEGAAGDGSSWDKSADLADALKWANEKVDENLWDENSPLQIYVATGTYLPKYSPEDGVVNSENPVNNRDKTFLLVKNVQLYGGFDLENSITELSHQRIIPSVAGGAPANGTILSGDLGASDIDSDNAYHVVLSVGDVGKAVLDGFTIRKGYAKTEEVAFAVRQVNVNRGYGGGMYNEDSSPELTNVTLSGNTATVYGGGMLNHNSSPKLTNVTLNGNTATNNGGGISNYNSSPVLTNVTLSGNEASNRGGGMYNDQSSPELTNVTLSGNTADGGGGMYNYFSSPLLRNVTLSSNKATNNGGGMYNYSKSSPVLTNVTFSGNKAENGGGIYNGDQSSPKVYNSIIWGNTKMDGTINNIYNKDNSTPGFYHSLVQGCGGSGASWKAAFGIDGVGNIDADPLFTDAANGDYTLANGSPAIDKGDNGHYTGLDADTKDLAGNPRLIGSTIDMGAYEFQGVSYTPDGNNILYVNQSVNAGNGSGDSWENAIPELADALKWANDNVNANLWDENTPLQIYVAKGTYKPKYSPEDGTDKGRDNTFLLVKNVQLYGGFDPDNGIIELSDERIIPIDGEAPPNPNRTILSGDLGTAGDDSENAYHVVLSVGNVGEALLDGFTIKDGNANKEETAFKVRGVDINRGYGGGMLNLAGSSPKLTNVMIADHAAVYGGGMYNDQSSPVLSNVILSNNTATTNGGGMYNWDQSSPVLTDVIIRNNSGRDGGGIINNKNSSPMLTNVRLSDNRAVKGGGMCNENSSPVLTNVTLSGNTAYYGGGGMYNYNNSSPKVYNSIIWGNTKTGGTTVDNIYNEDNSTSRFYNSLVQGSVGSGASWDTAFGTDELGNIDADPLFTNAANGDYTLASGSPAIDAGDNGHYTGLDADTKDLAGNPRLIGSTIDMGAYEFQGVSYTPNGNNILYVSQSVNAGNGSGDSWVNAIPDLADALKWANDNVNANLWDENTPLQIYVAKGTYLPKYSPEDGPGYGTDKGRDNTFLLVKNVQLYGGFDPGNGITELSHARIIPIDEETSADGTILSGDLGTAGDKDDNAYHVVVSVGNVGNALLDGFTIRRGYAKTEEVAFAVRQVNINRGYGGGMLNLAGSSPKLTNVMIADHAAVYGGGVYNDQSSPLLSNVILSGNEATTGGGGMYNWDQSSPVLKDVVIRNNSANTNGGGVYNQKNSSPALTNVVIRDNTAKYGGGIYNLTSSSPVLTNVTLSSNKATNNGGGMYNDQSSPVLTNVTLSGNKADNDGGGIHNYNSSPKVYNSILWGNTKWDGTRNNIGNDSSSKPEFYNSLVQSSGGSGASWNTAFGTDGMGNIDADPLFTDAANGDYTLANGSPAINKGNNGDYTDKGNGDLANDLDLAGNPRVYDYGNGGVIDMGAYEYQGVSYTPDGNNILYVSQSVNAGNGSGDSWVNAIPDLADALKWANDNVNANLWDENTPLQIYVAKGTYKPKYSPEDGTDKGRDNTFLLVKNVQLYGGFDPGNGITDLSHARIIPIDEETSANGTILSGDLGASGDNSDNAYHVVLSIGNVNNAVLDGFTIKDGNANKEETAFKVRGVDINRGYGGGMYNHTSSPLLTNVALSDNRAFIIGGGMYNEDSSPKMTNVTLSGNTAREGGGIYNSYPSSPKLTNVTISGNTARVEGGGMYNYIGSSPVLRNVTLSGNKADNDGGGIHNYNSSPKVYNSILWGNTKMDGTINNIGNDSSSKPEFYNSLVQSSGGSGASWNTAFGTDKSGNIDADPLFTDAANGDYTLANGSPAIDKGDNEHYTGLDANTKDLAGNLRVYDYGNGGIIDMGAYEYQGGTLPVHLGRFNARVENIGVKLEWNTLSEYNNQSFIIYRSADGVNYSPITWEPGKGNGPHVYVVFDNQPLNGINYYRLVQTDHDGKQTILGERSLTFEIPDSMIRLYPNPFRDAFTIDFETDAFKQLLVLDVTGKVLQQLAIASLESSKTVSMAGYPSGTYLVVLKGITNVVTQKVVKE